MYKVKINKVEKLTHDVVRLTTDKPQDFSFQPGQAVKVAIDKPGWQDQKRPFTLTGLNKDDYLQFIIKQYPRAGVTEKIHQLVKGDVLEISKPFGAIRYKGQGLFIAGGAGITPFIAIFKKLKKENKLSGNKLIYSNKTSQDVILKEKLKSWFTSQDLILVLTQEKKKGYYHKRIGPSLLKKMINQNQGKYYICGPWKMVEEIKLMLIDLDVPKKNIIHER